MFDAMYSLLRDSSAASGPAGPAGSPASPPPTDAAPTESDLWIAQSLYEFTVGRSVCLSCGAALGRRVTLTAVPAHPGSVWRIDVDARCRGLRRHRHAAEVTEAQGGLRFGDLLPVSA